MQRKKGMFRLGKNRRDSIKQVGIRLQLIDGHIPGVELVIDSSSFVIPGGSALTIAFGLIEVSFAASADAFLLHWLHEVVEVDPKEIPSTMAEIRAHTKSRSPHLPNVIDLEQIRKKSNAESVAALRAYWTRICGDEVSAEQLENALQRYAEELDKATLFISAEKYNVDLN
jgi:hypothetical protein